MFKKLENSLHPNILALFYIYIYIAPVFVIMVNFPLNLIFLFLQLFIVIWEVGGESPLSKHWVKLWKNLRNGFL